MLAIQYLDILSSISHPSMWPGVLIPKDCGVQAPLVEFGQGVTTTGNWRLEVWIFLILSLPCILAMFSSLYHYSSC